MLIAIVAFIINKIFFKIPVSSLIVKTITPTISTAC